MASLFNTNAPRVGHLEGVTLTIHYGTRHQRAIPTGQTTTHLPPPVYSGTSYSTLQLQHNINPAVPTFDKRSAPP